MLYVFQIIIEYVVLPNLDQIWQSTFIKKNCSSNKVFRRLLIVANYDLSNLMGAKLVLW